MQGSSLPQDSGLVKHYNSHGHPRRGRRRKLKMELRGVEPLASSLRMIGTLRAAYYTATPLTVHKDNDLRGQGSSEITFFLILLVPINCQGVLLIPMRDVEVM